MKLPTRLGRRQLLQAGTVAALACVPALEATPRVFPGRGDPSPGAARIAITLDLEMSRNFPVWDATQWDYEKGNLNDETKLYSLEAARRVKAAGGVLHFFAVGRVLEQADVTWLKELSAAGHPIGNHTYDHVNLLATRQEDLQFRFQRAPWLLRGLPVEEAIRENIRLAGEAMQSRLGLQFSGFRTPGGFSDGLRQHPAIRAMLQELGFTWVSSLYPSHPNTQPLQEPDEAVLNGILKAHQQAQPFAYPDGLIEVPMSPISDIGAFRTGRWKLDWFLRSIRQCVQWTIENGAVFDFLAHPSCLYVVDPEFRAIELICELVREAGDRAAIVDLNSIAAGVSGKTRD
ncbi:MAG: polysaccharide deacetylase family protein [Planctomycetota bacterium]